MTNTVKKIVIGLVGLFVIVILIMTWFYPYSIFSISKSYSFTPDSVVADEYLKDLNEFKNTYEKDLEELTTDRNIDLTTDRTQYLLPLYEQDWLVSTEPLKMSMEDLDEILFEVKNNRKILLELLGREDYTKEHRQYLINNLESLLSLEEEIIDIKTEKAESLKTLKIQFGNLHGSFVNNFMMFEIFYERFQGE
ncbi:hypothetical protein GH741_07815 [Aquibacillus halophilus]|uniref:Uncharacterized protein n=1 Tax=Aquibacillus halophilus TaxID=930132 RepID=A0A6A8DFG2_9BACI|nr:hypothetical protein [Aquibacillus halophilus]MRH42589.1 hypothetical protein [Aquibacillus halophilus]